MTRRASSPPASRHPPSQLVSVLMSAYNHEAYVGDAIRSVLAQTHQELELVIVDDGSTDGTPEAIRSFTDPRIRCFRQDNEGPSGALNRAFRESRGGHIAILSGDDVSLPNRLELQLAAMKGGDRVLFGGVSFIDSEGKPLPDGTGLKAQFPHLNLPAPQIFERLFLWGNYFNASTAFMSRAALEGASNPAWGGPFHPLLLQLQDFQLWLRLVQTHELHILPETLVKYRVQSRSRNLSAPTRRGLRRVYTEQYLLCDGLLEQLDDTFFRAAFGAYFKKPPADAGDRRCEEAFLCLKSHLSFLKLLGIERLSALWQTPEGRKRLWEGYGFDVPAFGQATAASQIFTLEPTAPVEATLTVLSKGGKKAPVKLTETLFPDDRHFSVVYNLPGTGFELAEWSPVEGRPCRVTLEALSWSDGTGTPQAVHPVAWSDLQSNGIRIGTGTTEFPGRHAAFSFPVAPRARSVKLEGTLELLTLDEVSRHIRSEKELAMNATLYLDLGDGYSEAQCARQAWSTTPWTHAFNFTFEDAPHVRTLRWDPLEGRFSKVIVESVTCWDRAGRGVDVPLDRLASNGVELASGTFRFLTLDPAITFSAGASVARVQIFARVEVPSLRELEAQLSERPMRSSTLFLDGGSGFSEGNAVKLSYPKESPFFSLSYDVAGLPQRGGFRWDPLEGEQVSVRVFQAVAWDAADVPQLLTLKKPGPQGVLLPDGTFEFRTEDPNLYFELKRPVKRIRIEGKVVPLRP